MPNTAVVLAAGQLRTIHGKTTHGLLRGSRRFRVVAVVDPECGGMDAGEVLEGKPAGIPVFTSLAAALAGLAEPPEYCVVGVASHGGRLPKEIRVDLAAAVGRGISVVNGLHEYAGDDPDIAAAAAGSGAQIIDVRRPRPKSELHFWSGTLRTVRAPRIAVLGTDCAVGKRTTAKLLVDACNRQGVAAEMIYTGQTGWMLGFRFGIVLDSLPNDFVAGELEHAIVSCDREAAPDVMVIEGQSSLRNPCGPCGAELLLSAGARGVILQHQPGRLYFEGFEDLGLRIPPISEEIALISLYGARTVCVALNGGAMDGAALARERDRLERDLGLPVRCPFEEGADALVPLVREFLRREREIGA